MLAYVTYFFGGGGGKKGMKEKDIFKF